ncbi:MAG: dihydrodipicolinate synthase family protein [Stappiaceae bacterium]
MTRYPGIHCVLYALFDGSQRLDAGAMRQQTELVQRPGVRGINVLGLATEVQKLTSQEKRQIIDIAAESRKSGTALSVTISGNSVAEQTELAACAIDRGADLLILQPPAVGAFPASAYLDFFCAVADGFDIPLSVQNAPQFLGRSLSDADIAELCRRNPNFSHIKSETSAVELSGLIMRCGEKLTVLNGRGGLEMTDCLRVGCEGFIVAPDILDHVTHVYQLWQNRQFSDAEEAYQCFLPAALFVMQSIETLICYGKRIFAQRAGFEITDRMPAMMPTEPGLELAARWADQLGSFGKSLEKTGR